MDETNYKSPLLYLEEEWDLLMPSEKSLMISYRRLLRKGLKVSPMLIIAVNQIHEKYPDFHIGCIPSDSAISHAKTEIDSEGLGDPA